MSNFFQNMTTNVLSYAKVHFQKVDDNGVYLSYKKTIFISMYHYQANSAAFKFQV